MKILLPMDGSEHSKRMLSYIAAHDELLGPRHEYILFTAVPPIPPHAARHLDRGTVDAYQAEQADEVLRSAKAFADMQHWKVSVAHVSAPAADAITAIAERVQVDLIVMGTHGHSSLVNVILGSVASGVLARCKVPVLLIR